MNIKRLSTLLSERRMARRAYCRLGDWLWSIYSDIETLRNARVPWRYKVCAVDSPLVDGPVYLRAGASDWFVFEEIFLHKEYSFVEQGGGAPVQTVLDLGSNIGLSIRYWLMMFPNAKIVGIEPDSSSFMIAERNVGESASLLRACVNGTSGTAYLNATGAACGFTVTNESTSPDAQAVKAMTIPEIKENAGIQGDIDLLKCDIEGAEQQLFSDCADWIGCVKRIAIEIHPPYTVRNFLRDLDRGGSKLKVKRSNQKQHLHTLFLAD